MNANGRRVLFGGLVVVALPVFGAAACRGSSGATAPDVNAHLGLIASTVTNAPDGSVDAAVLQDIEAYYAQAFYEDGDIVHSFTTVMGDDVDCIDFYAQHSVKATLALGIPVPTAAPSLPLPPSVTPPRMPRVTFTGEADENGQARACPTGAVPTMRPSVSEIQQAGGLGAFKAGLAARHHPNGSQSSWEHDC